MDRKLPVLILAFNRADHVVKAMQPLKKYRPNRIYLECDGAREGKVGEYDAVSATKKAMLGAIDWPCEIKTLFRDKNIGCAEAVYDAVSWFFQNEEYGIVIEDDVVLSQDFFSMCEILLPMYKNDHRIMHISAENHSGLYNNSDSYVFVKRPLVWGWASWARAWNLMDMEMRHWNNFLKIRLLPYFGIIRTALYIKDWNLVYKKPKQSSSWATRWHFALWANNGLCISPYVQLSQNIGTDGGTHFEKSKSDLLSYLHIGKLEFPLHHPSKVKLSKLFTLFDTLDWWILKLKGLYRKLRNVFNYI